MLAVDLLILLLAAARLTRLVVADDVGDWLLREPAHRWALRTGAEWRVRLVQGLDCPWCVGFWLGLALVLLLALAGGPGDAAAWWRIGAGALALNFASTALGTLTDSWDRGEG